MTAKAGRDVVLQIQVGAAMQTLGGMQVTTLMLRNTLNETNRTRWREVLAGRGGQALRLVARGIFEESASEAVVRTAAFAKTLVPFRLLFGNGDAAAGEAVVAAYETTGAVDGMEGYGLTLESSGPVVLTPAM
jgi:predicted secreted protein